MKEFILWEAYNSEDHRPQSEWNLGASVSLYSSSLSHVLSSNQDGNCAHSSCKAKQARKRKVRVGGLPDHSHHPPVSLSVAMFIHD